MDEGVDLHFLPFRRICLHLKYFKTDYRVDGIQKVHFQKFEWEDFSRPNVSFLYLFYRILHLGLFYIILLTSLIYQSTLSDGLNYYFIFFTHWTLILDAIYSTLFLISVSISKYTAYKNKKQVKIQRNRNVQSSPDFEGVSEVSQNIPQTSAISINRGVINQLGEKKFVRCQLPPLEIVIWILLPVCFISSIIVTLGYWVFLYAEVAETEIVGYQIQIHGVNAILILFDILLTGVPIHVTHFINCLIFGIFYIFFAGIYEAAGSPYPPMRTGRYIYNFLNWKDQLLGTIFIVPIAGAILVIFLHLIALFFYSLRLYFVYKLFKKSVYLEHIYEYKEIVPRLNDEMLLEHVVSQETSSKSIGNGTNENT